MPKKPMRALLLGAAAVALLTAGVAAGQGGSSSGSTDLSVSVSPCGVNTVVDKLFSCTTSTASSTSPSGPRSPASASSPRTAQLQGTIAMRRSPTRATYMSNLLVVRFRRGVTQAQVSAELRGLGARTRSHIAALRIRTVAVEPARRDRVLAQLRRSPLVARADKDEVLRTMGVVTPNDADYRLQWGVRLASFPAAWRRTHGAHVLVAVVDTGVSSVPDLAGAVRPGIDMIAGDSTPADTNGHGTAVAGVIAARANNGLGGAGVCSACTILPVKVMGAGGNGDLATVAAGIVRAADMHARVIDLSLGGPAGLDALQSSVAYATSKGAVVVAAAGNSGLGVPFYPANYPNVLSVAGSNPQDRLYSWSEHGTWVRITAPGCNVAPLVHGGYGNFCGTSSATPLVAGLAALYVAAHPRATPAQVIAAIEKKARRIKANVSNGRINAGATIGR
jgi:subtilisin family serine protease